MAVIEADGLTKRYGSRTVLDRLSLAVEPGEVFGIVGPNGAGKTTAVELMEGLRRPDAGSVRVLGLDPWTQGAALRQRIGVQLQAAQLPERLKVAEALELYASFYRAPRDWRELLQTWGLAEVRSSAFAKLSGGQRQRLLIALALVGEPEVAFLDELTTGLDPNARRLAWDLVGRVRASGVTVVLVSHFMDEVEQLCDRVALLDGGRLVATGTPGELVERAGIGQRLRFRPLGPLDERSLAGLPGVTQVRRSGQQIEVAGTGGFAQAVAGWLALEHIVVADLRLEGGNLDDAYVAITGRGPAA